MKIHLKVLHKGDIFYDCEYGLSMKCKVLAEPEQDPINDGWKLKVKHSRGQDEFFQTNDEGCQFLINFYDEPIYPKII